MMKNLKKSKLTLITAWLLTAVMLLQLVPALGVFATETVKSGVDGNISWIIDSDGVLTFSGIDGNISWSVADGVLTLSGTGDMNNYDYWDNPAPWKNLKFTTAVIEEGVTSIGDDAFEGCAGLTSITLPDGITSIGEFAFYDCTGLTSVTLPVSLTSIGNGAFGDCWSLTSITIPKNVTFVSGDAFSGCNKLESILVDNSNTAYTSSDGILYSKDMTQLVACPGAKSGALIVPDSVVAIGDEACADCDDFSSIILPNSLAFIGDSAFSSCTDLKTVYYYGTEAEWNEIIADLGNGWLLNAEIIFLDGEQPDAYTKISWTLANDGTLFLSGSGVMNDYGYRNDAPWIDLSFTTAVIEEGILSIGENAFSNCNDLTSITLPNSLVHIGDYAFNYSDLLTTVYYYGTEAEWNEISIGSKNDKLLNAEIIFLDGEQPSNPDTPEDNEKPENLGDANGDGAVDAIDAARVLMIDAGLVELTEADIEACDANCDGSVDAIDAAHILRFDAGLIEEL